MAEVAQAWVSLLPSTRGFGARLTADTRGEVDAAGKKLGTGFGKVFALAGGALAAAGIGNFLSDSIEEAREAQKVGALTESIIKSTGGAAKVTAAQVGDLASAISLKTGMDDEAIQAGANMLLTFKNVRNEVGEGANIFDRATQAAADLSAAGFGDVNGQAKMLGKALNDPIKGMSALGRSGVTFTAQQQEQIKAMVASGDTLKAQQTIMREVESQVGGAAAASATAGEKASVAFGNLKEDVGTALLPVIDAAANAFVKMAPAISQGIGAIGPALSSAQQFLAPFVARIQSLFGGGGGGGILAGLQSFAGTVRANFLPVLKTAASTFTGTILPAVTTFAGYMASRLLPVFQQVWGIIQSKVIPIVASVAKFLYGTLVPAVARVVTAVGKNLRPVFDAIVKTLQANVLPAVSKLLDKFREWLPTIQKVIGVVVKVVGAVLKFASAILGKVLPPVIKFAGFLLGKLVGAIGTVIGWVVKIIGKVVDFGVAIFNGGRKVVEFALTINRKIGEVVLWFTKLPGKIKGALSGAATWLVSAGRDIVRGLLNGLDQARQWIIDKVSALANLIPGWLKKRLGIASPSKVTTLIGAQVGQGLAVGIAGARGKIVESVETVLAGLEKSVNPLIRQAEAWGDKIADALGTKGVKGGLAKRLKGLRADVKGIGNELGKALADGMNLKDRFESLRDAVTSAFKSDWFSSIGTEAEYDDDGNLVKPAQSAVQNFLASLTQNKGMAEQVSAAFAKLKTIPGLSKEFLSALLSSGNSELILGLANGPASALTEANALFGQVNAITDTLGRDVAGNELGKGIYAVRDEIKELRKEIRLIGGDVGDAVNDAAARGQRAKKRKAKK